MKKLLVAASVIAGLAFGALADYSQQYQFQVNISELDPAYADALPSDMVIVLVDSNTPQAGTETGYYEIFCMTMPQATSNSGFDATTSKGEGYHVVAKAEGTHLTITDDSTHEGMKYASFDVQIGTDLNLVAAYNGGDTSAGHWSSSPLRYIIYSPSTGRYQELTPGDGATAKTLAVTSQFAPTPAPTPEPTSGLLLLLGLAGLGLKRKQA